MNRFGEAQPRVNWDALGRTLLGAICVFLVAGMLVAGLWPFHSPRNQVTWIAGRNGLHFGRHATILSSGKFRPNTQEDAPCSIELWLEPDLIEGTASLVILRQKARQFSLTQSISDLELRTDVRRGRYRTRTTRLYVSDIFRRGKPMFISITSGIGQTSVYVDGRLALTAGAYPLSSRDFEGELVVAGLGNRQ